MEINKKELLEIYDQESTIAAAAREYAKRHNLEYSDSLRRKFSNYINSEKEFDEDLENETVSETNQYKNDNEGSDVDFFMPSAWEPQMNRFLSIDEYCDKYGLPKDQVRSSKLVSHMERHMVYNIAFNPTLNEQTGIDEEVIENIVKKYIERVDIKPFVASGNKEWVDRVIITDIHISMSTEGGKNITPLYEGEWNEDQLFKRLNILVENIVQFKRGDALIIDELGDYMDGLFGQTTRKGHELPQNMSDKKAFEVGIDFKVKLVESLLPHYSKIICNNITEDNHAGVFGYFVNSAVKKIVETKYKNIEYNLLERFINHYSVGNHTFILSHGKDSESMKFGFKPQLDAKQADKIDQYCKEYKLYDGKNLEFSKGDSHQALFDYTTSNDFHYCNYPAFSPASNWVKVNFSNSKSGFVIQNIEVEGNIKINTPIWFEK